MLQLLNGNESDEFLKYLVILIYTFIVNIFLSFVIAVGDVPGCIMEGGRKLYHETLWIRQ